MSNNCLIQVPFALERVAELIVSRGKIRLQVHGFSAGSDSSIPLAILLEVNAEIEINTEFIWTQRLRDIVVSNRFVQAWRIHADDDPGKAVVDPEVVWMRPLGPPQQVSCSLHRAAVSQGSGENEQGRRRQVGGAL